MKPAVVAPIFIVGCHRSGTTVLYRKLALHPDVTFITRTTKKVSSPLWLMRLLKRFRTDEQNATPTGGDVWNKIAPRDDHSLFAADATPAAIRYFHQVVRN